MTIDRSGSLFRLSRVILAGVFLASLAACGESPPPKAVSKAAPPAPPTVAPAEQPKVAEAAPKANPAEANKALAARVKQELVARKVRNAQSIDVTAESGMVTLFGAVDDKQSREMAETVASGVQGVGMVHNNLVIASGS